MLSPTALRRRLETLGLRAMDALLASEAEPATEPPAAALRLDTTDPLEHLRRALLAAKASDTTAGNPKHYRQLRLLLNQLESGRVSSEPTRQITRTPLSPVATPRPRLGSLLRRKAQATVRRLFT